MVAENLFTLDCISCGKRHVKLAISCCECGVPLTPLKSKNPFEIFGLAPTLAITRDALKKSYLEAQKALHPDRFIANPKIFAFATQISARVNDALAALSCPVRRAQAFLCAHSMNAQLEGVCVPPDTLEEMLALQEKAQSEEPQERYEVLEEVQTLMKKTQNRLADAVSAKYEQEARVMVAVLSYLLRIYKNAKKTQNKPY